MVVDPAGFQQHRPSCVTVLLSVLEAVDELVQRNHEKIQMFRKTKTG
jgi:hypothetical protein